MSIEIDTMTSFPSQEYPLSTLSPSTSHAPRRLSKSSGASPDPAPSPPRQGAQQQEKQPELPPVSHNIPFLQSTADRDIEAQYQPRPLPRTLAAHYPIRGLDGCCRTILMLHFEFGVYAQAIEAGEQNKKFDRMDDLEHAIESLVQIVSGIEHDERGEISG